MGAVISAYRKNVLCYKLLKDNARSVIQHIVCHSKMYKYNFGTNKNAVNPMAHLKKDIFKVPGDSSLIFKTSISVLDLKSSAERLELANFPIGPSL